MTVNTSMMNEDKYIPPVKIINRSYLMVSIFEQFNICINYKYKPNVFVFFLRFSALKVRNYKQIDTSQLW